MTRAIYRANLYVLVILFFAAILSAHFSFAAVTTNLAPSVSVLGASSTPSVSAVTINNGNAVTLIANATQTVTVSFTVTDTDGCADVFTSGNITSTLYRAGVSSTCSANTLNCYIVSTSTSHSCSVATTTSANATATFQLYYFADATDASSTYPSQDWQARVLIRDGGGLSSSTTSTVGVELNTLLALHVVTSSVDYGTLSPNSNTSSTNQITTVKNAGNSSSSLGLSGTALVSGSNSIPTSSQHYATSTFTYGGIEQQLQSTAQTVSGFTILRPVMDQSWAFTGSTPASFSLHALFAYGGYLYTVGADQSGVARNFVFFAPISATGSVGSWSASSTFLPVARARLDASAYNGYAYAVGGIDNNDEATSSIVFAPFSATGSVGSWLTGTALPAPIYDHKSPAYNGYLYRIGGIDAATGLPTSSVFFAPINATGSIGAWSSTTPLPSGLGHFSAGIHNDYLYIFGGSTGGGSTTATVIHAPINATGSIGAWRYDIPLPHTSTQAEAVIDAGVAYFVGGTLDGSITSTVFFASLHNDGSVGPWSTTTAFPENRRDHGIAAYNGYAYVTNGTDGIVNKSSVYFIPLASRNTYWGLSVPAGAAQGLYSGITNFTAIFSP